MPSAHLHTLVMSAAVLLVLIAAGSWEIGRPNSGSGFGSGDSVASRASPPSAAEPPDPHPLVAVLPTETADCLTMHYEADLSAGVRRLRMQTVRAPVTDDAIELLLRYSLQVRVRGGLPPPRSPPAASVLFTLGNCPRLFWRHPSAPVINRHPSSPGRRAPATSHSASSGTFASAGCPAPDTSGGVYGGAQPTSARWTTE